MIFRTERISRRKVTGRIVSTRERKTGKKERGGKQTRHFIYAPGKKPGSKRKTSGIFSALERYLGFKERDGKRSEHFTYDPYAKRKSSKGMVQTDYIIALGIFIVVFGLLVAFTTGFLQNMKDTSEITGITNNAFSLLGVADFAAQPSGWPETLANDSVVLLMHFTNNTTAVNDYSSQGNNGTVNGALWNVSGKFGAAYSFDGVDDYINVSDKLDMGTNDFTLSAWVKTSSSANYQAIISKRVSGGPWDGYRLWLYQTCGVGNPAIIINDADTVSDTLICTDTPINDGNWHHLVGAFDRDGNGTVYIDGVLKNSSSIATQSSSVDNSGEFRIGQGSATDNPFNGTIDEVVIWNRSLSADEILNLSQPERRLDKIGLKSRAYRFTVIVNNTATAYINQSLNVSNLPTEIVSVNLSNILPRFNIDSVNVYDPDNNTVAHQQDGSNITFITNINANTAQIYTIYVDDDGVYENRSGSVSGTDNLTETVLSYEKVDILDYQALRAMDGTDYNLTKNATGIGNFNVTLYDTNSSSDVFSFGTAAPRRGDVVALQRFFAYLNSTGGLRPGRLTVKAW